MLFDGWGVLFSRVLFSKAKEDCSGYNRHEYTESFNYNCIRRWRKTQNACTIAQNLWGPDAGGREGIAGSPRNWDLDESQLYAEFDRAREAIETLIAKQLQ